MNTNPLNEFGKSRSILEQDKPSKSALAEGMGGQVEGNEKGGQIFQQGEDGQRTMVAVLPGQPNEATSIDRPEGRVKASTSSPSPLNWWEQSEDRGESLQSRTPLFEIGSQVPDLHGFRPVAPENTRKYEKYEHRIIAELKAAGKSNREIEDITGYCATSVSAITKLPWVKQFIMDEIHRHGGQNVMNYMAQHAQPAAEIVVSGFMDAEMEARRDRVAAANSLLDRLYGKANQNIITHKGPDLNKLSDAELAAMLPIVNELGNS